jgi:hypothetical protein
MVQRSKPGGGEFYRTRPERPWCPPSLYTMGTGSFLWVKRPGRGVDHPPPSSSEVKERVQLYLYSPSGPSWPVLGWPLPLHYSTDYFWPVLTKNKFSKYISYLSPPPQNVKSHQNSSRERRMVPCGQTDKHSDSRLSRYFPKPQRCQCHCNVRLHRLCFPQHRGIGEVAANERRAISDFRKML